MRELTALAIVLLLLLSEPCLSANRLAAPSAPPVCSFLHPEEGAWRDSGMGAFLPVLPLASLRANEPLCTAMAWQAEKKPRKAARAAGSPGSISDLLHLVPSTPWAKGGSSRPSLPFRLVALAATPQTPRRAEAMGAVPAPSTHRRPLSQLPGGAGGALSPAVCFELRTPASCKVPYLESSRSPERLPGGPHPRQVKRPSRAAISSGPGGTPALSLRGFPPRRGEQVVTRQSQP